jgi:crotonobetainyl-CoA:carnitine CoA-transferase CaiB-like acyl-CoA transferase
VIAIITDNFWQNLKPVVNVEAFNDPKYDGQPGRFADKAFIDNTLTELFKTNTNKFWLDQLEAARIPCAPVNKFSDVLNDAQVLHRNMVVDIHHPDGKSTKAPGNPIKMSRSHEDTFSAAPHIGQHTEEVLSDLLDLSADQIEKLRNSGIVK